MIVTNVHNLSNKAVSIGFYVERYPNGFDPDMVDIKCIDAKATVSIVADGLFCRYLTTQDDSAREHGVSWRNSALSFDKDGNCFYDDVYIMEDGVTIKYGFDLGIYKKKP